MVAGPEDDTAVIRVERADKGYADRVRSYRILLDGVKVGTVRAGDHVIFSATPGHHRLRLAIDFCRSQIVELDLSADQEVRFECWPKARMLAWPFWLTFGSRRYIGIRRLLPSPSSAVDPKLLKDQQSKATADLERLRERLPPT